MAFGHFAQHACSHPLEMMMGLLSLIEGGVLEAHPRLRVGVLEAGCGWLPYWLWRLDHVEYEQFQSEVRRNMKMPPSEYFKRQCWIAIEPGEALLGPAIDHHGSGNIVFGTDFPHLDHGTTIVDEAMKLREVIGDDKLGTILWRSGARLLGHEA